MPELTERATKRDAIAYELRRLILAGEMPRGTRLHQDELARRFDASITPVREALRDLESEGLVESEPHRGVRVASIELDRLKAIYIARRLLEGYAATRAATRMSPRSVAKARLLLSEIVEARDGGDLFRARDLNREFHFFIYSHCGLPNLITEISRYWQVFPWDMVLTEYRNIDDASEEHETILVAIEAGDAAATGRAVAEHIREGFRAIAARVSGSEDVPDPFDLDAD